MRPGNANRGRTIPLETADALGRASHALEDFFSHSNFVDIAIGYDADFRRAAGPATDTSLRTGTFGPKSVKHSISHKIHALMDELPSHPQIQMAPLALLAIQSLENLATDLEKTSMEDDAPGTHTRLAKDQPAWTKTPPTPMEALQTLRFNLAHQCAVAADRAIIGGVKKVITAPLGSVDAEMESVSEQLFKMIAPPTPSHPLWPILASKWAEAAKLIAQLPAPQVSTNETMAAPKPVPGMSVVTPPPPGAPLLKKR
jgi:hypothetical protein